jgi:hypothetical protein
MLAIDGKRGKEQEKVKKKKEKKSYANGLLLNQFAKKNC